MDNLTRKNHCTCLSKIWLNQPRLGSKPCPNMTFEFSTGIWCSHTWHAGKTATHLRTDMFTEMIGQINWQIITSQIWSNLNFGGPLHGQNSRSEFEIPSIRPAEIFLTEDTARMRNWPNILRLACWAWSKNGMRADQKWGMCPMCPILSHSKKNVVKQAKMRFNR